jgi:hypothetical protein
MEITGKPVITISHCKVMALRKSSEEFRAFYNSQLSTGAILRTINVRDALYGKVLRCLVDALYPKKPLTIFRGAS